MMSYVLYRFNPSPRVRASVQLNILFVLDSNRVWYLVILRAPAPCADAQWFNAPRKYSVTTSWSL